MEEVEWVLEEAVVGQLRAETCAEVLIGSRGLGLAWAEAAAEALALDQFEEVAGTERFLELEEEVVGRLMEALRGLFGADKVPPFQASHVTRWRADGLARGAYSYMKVRSFALLPARSTSGGGGGAVLFDLSAPASQRGSCRVCS